MTMAAPPIDPRGYEEIVQQTTELVKEFTGLEPTTGDPDATYALIRIFGRMMEHAITRLNRVPEKHFLAFLDMIGVQQQPPRPARAPLTFALANGSPEEALGPVPARTQVAAKREPGEQAEVIFETERELMLTSAQLVAIFVREPVRHYADHSAIVTSAQVERTQKSFAAFVGDRPIEHSLYLGHHELFAIPLPKIDTKELTIKFTNATKPFPQFLWSYWDGKFWQRVPERDVKLIRDVEIVLTNLSALPLTLLHNHQAAWLKAELATHLFKNTQQIQTKTPLEVTSITVTTEINVPPKSTANATALQPDVAFSNTTQLDLTKDFHPFGEKPRFNDTFYFASDEAFNKPQTQVSIVVKLGKAGVAKEGLTLVWEMGCGQQWQNVAPQNGELLYTNKVGVNTINLTVPNEVAPTIVNGQSKYWLRVRIIKGNFGVDASLGPEKDDKGNLVLKPATFEPPVIERIRIGYTYKIEAAPLSACLTYNDFTFQDVTTRVEDGNKDSIALFTPTTDQHPTLYLGFDRPFANRAISLYFDVEPALVSIAQRVEQPARLQWQYSATDKEWRTLAVEDETANLTTSGLVTLIGPTDFARRREFAQEHYWLRVQWVAGQYSVPPRLRAIRTNTTWASQRVTIQHEILGSGNGEANQRLATRRAPVLNDARLEVREREVPSPSERVQIEQEEGADAISLILDGNGQPSGAWVRWHPVVDFHASGARDRHYVLDPLNGVIQWGNGTQGLLPPRGHNNLRLTYGTGGGVPGNRPVHTLTSLKTTIPYVAGVTNHQPASGGAAAETLEQVKQRGPTLLRHGGRATTAQDFADLALLASPEVARAMTIQTAAKDNAGRVQVVVVPHSPESQPRLTLALQQQVEAYLRARCSPTLQLKVIEPAWVAVTVTAVVSPISLSVANTLADRLIGGLHRFLHPLTGGFDGAGWPFGRQPQKSDLYAWLERQAGVDHVRALTIALNLDNLQSHALVYSGSHAIEVFAGEAP